MRRPFVSDTSDRIRRYKAVSPISLKCMRYGNYDIEFAIGFISITQPAVRPRSLHNIPPSVLGRASQTSRFEPGRRNRISPCSVWIYPIPVYFQRLVRVQRIIVIPKPDGRYLSSSFKRHLIPCRAVKCPGFVSIARWVPFKVTPTNGFLSYRPSFIYSNVYKIVGYKYGFTCLENNADVILGKNVCFRCVTQLNNLFFLAWRKYSRTACQRVVYRFPWKSYVLEMLYSRVKTNSNARIAVSLESRERFWEEDFCVVRRTPFSHVRWDPAHGGIVNNGNFPSLSPATIGRIWIHSLCFQKITHFFGASHRKKAQITRWLKDVCRPFYLLPGPTICQKNIFFV